MRKHYEFFCFRDRLFYDVPLVDGEGSDFSLVLTPAPSGWQRQEFGDWVAYVPVPADLPSQGWKIHVSSVLQDAESVAAKVFAYCERERIAFKLIRSKRALFLRDSKSADRTASGKFITIYPRDEGELERILRELGRDLNGHKGPAILSDLRWESGPLYVRYGGFTPRWTSASDGEPESAIEAPDGTLVPDRRATTFVLPAWVELPSFLKPQLAARNSITFAGVPYLIEAALHFSNAGGIYLAKDERNDETVVIKEARPFAGLSAEQVDAIARLRHERDILQRLAGIAEVPSLRDYFTLGEQEYLVQDFASGDTLNTLFVSRYPLVGREPDPVAASRYASWVIEICNKVESAVARIHERGIVVGDVHPSNILVSAANDIHIIDWETAAAVETAQQPALGTPDFMAPADRRGFAVDKYALASLRLHMFLPLTALINLDLGKAFQLERGIHSLFSVPKNFISEAVAEVVGDKMTASEMDDWLQADLSNTPWIKMRDSMIAAITQSATPERSDRLFPGDIAQFESNGGTNIATGAAGIFYAIHAVGGTIAEEHLDWLVRHASRINADTKFGFYDGLHGIAHIFESLGNRSAALRTLDVCLEAETTPAKQHSLDLHGGLAGIGLNLLSFASATGDAALRERATGIVQHVADRVLHVRTDATISGNNHPYAGLMRGFSGAALLFIRWFEETRDTAFLDLAAVALRRDLQCCVRTHDGALQVNEGWRTMPYLADGSVGIGLVLQDYLAHRHDEEFAAADEAIFRTAQWPFFIQSGLFAGRAGIVLYLSRRGRSAVECQNSQIRELAWHALAYRGNLAFPGDQLVRMSMDLATGTAGVMLALGAARGGDVCLPFLAASHAEGTH